MRPKRSARISLMAWWRHVPRALQVHVDDGVEVLLGHVPDHALAQDAGGVDDEIDLAEGLRALAHHAAGAGVVGDGVVVGERLAAGLGDLRHDLVGGALVVTSPSRPARGR